MSGILSRLFGREDDAPTNVPSSPEAAAAALLVEAALADGVYADLESDRIAMILLESFDFDADKADAILAEGETLAEEAVGAHEFTKHVKKLPMAQRASIVEGLYLVAFADGEKCPIEDAFIRHVASLLYVDDVPRAQARQRAEARSQETPN
ncbi:MAG: TerB family tellurite resistance protein [Pseudomonadota bacterium]